MKMGYRSVPLIVIDGEKILGFDKEKDISILWWHENAEIIKSYLTKYNY